MTTDTDFAANAEVKEKLADRLRSSTRAGKAQTKREARVVLPRCPTPSSAWLADLSDTESEMSFGAPEGKKGEKRVRDSDDTDSEASGLAVESERTGGERKRRPGRSGSVSSYDGDRIRPESPLPGTPTFLRVAELRKEKREAMLRQKEERLENRAKEASVSRAALGLDTSDPRTAAALHQRVVDDVGVIMEMATKSTNLKGTVVRALKESAASIRVAVEALHGRTTTQETAKLQAENARLQRDLIELRRELADLRTEFRRERAEAIRGPAPKETSPERTQPRGRRSEEQLTRSIMLQVGSMMGARLKELEERLLPGKRLRPPLAADKASSATTADPPPGPGSSLPGTAPLEPTPPGLQEPGQKRKGKEKGKGKRAKAAAETATAAPPTAQKKTAPRPVPSTTGEKWSTVVKRGAKPKAPAPGGAKAAKAAKPRGRPAPEKLRPPRSSAVVVTLQPGALEKGVTYAKVLSEARSKVDLASCDIRTGLRFKKAVTGGCILEVPGATSGDKADAFASKLREVLDPEAVRVSRPEKCADLRISGLDESTAVAEVVAAVARGGACPVAAVKAGEPRRDPRGSCTTWVRCPIAAAKKLAEGKRLLVGWTSAQVRLLEPRPMQCYRCLHKGHVQARCTAEVDRSDECYRCGQPGHKASRCPAAAPRCSLCAAANKPAEHRVGSRNCSPPQPKPPRAPTAQPSSSPPVQGGAKKTAPPSPSPPAQGGEDMDTGPQTAASQPASAQETPLLRQMAEWLTNSGR